MFDTLLNSEDFTKNKRRWARHAWQGDAVAVPGQHDESLSLQDKELYFAEFKMNYEKFGTPRASRGSQYLTQLGVHYKHLENGLDLRTMGKHIDLTEVGRRLYGFSYSVMQSIQGLAEGPAGPYYKHRQGVRYMCDFFVDLMMGGYYKDKVVF